MKWSEQMRELISIDENFNQLKLNTIEEELLINEEFIAKATAGNLPGLGTSVAYIVTYEDYNKIIKKYPFFTDIKFLFNCIFANDYFYSKVSEIFFYDEYIVILNHKSTTALVIYTEPQVTTG